MPNRSMRSRRPARMPLCLVAIVSLIAALAATFDSAWADYPERQITMIVCFPAGGGTDIAARLINTQLGEALGKPVIVENRGGAGGNIGIAAAARAGGDGYTILVCSSAYVVNPSLYAQVSYDPFKDFVPVMTIGASPNAFVVPAQSEIKSLPELIAKAKANPGKLNYGAGIITTRLAGYLFSRFAGIDTVFIPYKGSAEVVQGLLTGSIDFSIDGVSASLPLIKEGKLRALAKLNNRPLSVLPDVRPLSEVANLPELGEISSWAGLVAPAGTPPVVIDRIQRDVALVAADPEVSTKLQSFGIAAVSSTPVEFDRYYRGELDRWSKVFKDSGITLE